MARSSSRCIYGMRITTVKKFAKRCLFLQRLLVILEVNSTTFARALKVSTGTIHSWRQMKESIPPDIWSVVIEAYCDYADDPSRTWPTFAAALDRRAKAARLPGFGE